MFDFDFGLGDETDMLRDAVRAFAAERIAPLAQEIDQSNRFPRELWPALGELGLLGITVEENLQAALELVRGVSRHRVSLALRRWLRDADRIKGIWKRA